ncbi:hypothetical protein BGZ76_001201 [Entomortierella beljakovae]|nr:hypothetical protein BGZ76_001201 [Entomortierella beljakovae]
MEFDMNGLPSNETMDDFTEKISKEVFSRHVEYARIYKDDNDIPSYNGSLLFQDMLLYIELCNAIKSGDIGQIEDVIKWLTMMFKLGLQKTILSNRYTSTVVSGMLGDLRQREPLCLLS